MAKRLRDVKEIRIERPARAKLSEKEILKRMEAFPKRKEKFIATIRAGKHIAKAEMRNLITEVCRSQGYEPPITCTPEELLGQ